MEVWGDGSVTVASIATLVGKTKQTIRNWLDEGCPVAHRGGQGRANATRLVPSDVIEWMIFRETGADDGDGEGLRYNYEEAKARDKHFAAVRREAEARRELGMLIPVDIIADTVDKENAAVRSALMSLPGRLSVRLSAIDDPGQISRELTAEIDGALASLSSGDAIAVEVGADTSTSVFDHVDVLGGDDPEDDEEGEGDGD